MYLIIDGIDRSGKDTLADYLATRYRVPVLRFPRAPATISSSVDWYAGGNTYLIQAYHDLKRAGATKHVIVYRSLIDEWAYGNRSDYVLEQIKLWSGKLPPDTVLALMEIDFPTYQERRWYEPSVDMPTFDRVLGGLREAMVYVGAPCVLLRGTDSIYYNDDKLWMACRDLGVIYFER